MNDVFAELSLRRTYDAFAWICLVFVAALSIHAGVTGAIPVWLAAFNAIALGATVVPAIKRTVARRIRPGRSEPGPGRV
ncbi:hypothetical protein J2S65_005211 [Rhodococcus fascians]|nr:hypothetical protein [Rhodococcus fascians]